MLKVYFKNLIPKFRKSRTAPNTDTWEESITTHSCKGEQDIITCKACRYSSLKIGGFSDDCIKLMMSGSVVQPPMFTSPSGSIFESTYARQGETIDDTVKRIASAHSGVDYE